VAAEHSTESSAAQQEQERLTGVFQRFLASSSIVEPDESCADVGLKDQGFAQVLLARFYSSESGVRETAGTAPLRWRVRPHRRHWPTAADLRVDHLLSFQSVDAWHALPLRAARQLMFLHSIEFGLDKEYDQAIFESFFARESFIDFLQVRGRALILNH
jgi:hypothetical protein